MVRRLYWRIRIVWLALRWIPKPCLGDEVWHDNRRWTLRQGVCDPIWELCRPAQNNEGLVTVKADRRNFRKIKTPRNLWRSFMSGYRFYMGYWYEIWVMDGWRAKLGPKQMRIKK